MTSRSKLSELLADESINSNELDRIVAHMIVRDAQASGRRNAGPSLRRPSSIEQRERSDSRTGQPDKRFLASIIKSTERHNQQILEPRSSDAWSRRQAAHAEGASSGRLQRDGPISSHSTDRQGSQDAPSDSQASMRQLHSFTSGRSRHARREEAHELHERSVPSVREKRTRERSSSSSEKRSRREIDMRSGSSREVPRSQPSSAELPSKMDKYFSTAYDPLLDVSLDHSTDPKTGYIADGGWDAMSNNIADKGEVTREESPKRQRGTSRLVGRHDKGRSDARKREKDRDSSKESRKRGVDRERESRHRSRGSDPFEEKRRGKPAKTIRDDDLYGKRGSTRAWDLGKAGPLE